VLSIKNKPSTAGREVILEDGAKIVVCIYYPNKSNYGSGPYLVYFYFYGSRFILRNLITKLMLCISISKGVSIVIVSIDYCLCL
jgi:acetyl esterase/lipase